MLALPAFARCWSSRCRHTAPPRKMFVAGLLLLHAGEHAARRAPGCFYVHRNMSVENVFR